MTPDEKNTEQPKKTLNRKRKTRDRMKIGKTRDSSVKKGVVSEIANKILKMEKPSLHIIIKNIGFRTDVNDDVYSKNEIEKIQWIVNNMSKEIHIDKTYVSFPGNRWKDAFMVEEKWYELMKLIVGSDFGRRKYGKYSKKETDEIISSSIMAMSITYMYGVLENMGYDIENIELSPVECKFYSEYELDERTDWRF